MNASPHVVHVVRSDSFAGVERYVCDVAPALAERGWHVSVVGGEPELMRAALGPTVSHRAAATVAEAARGLLQIGRCDVVHAHMSAAELAALLTRPVTGAQVIATRHFASRRGSSTLARAGLALLARGLANEIAISQFVADSTRGHPSVILNGVRPQNKQSDLCGREVLVLQRLEPEKDTSTAIQAWALSGLAGRGWRLTVAGRGSERARMEALAAQLGVADSINFVGFLSDPEEARLRASVFLATAPREPFGLAVVEAMAQGLPIVAADGGAHRETVGDTGLLFAPGDARQGAQQLRRLAASLQLRTTLGAQARKRYARLLTLDRHLAQLESLYQATLG